MLSSGRDGHEGIVFAVEDQRRRLHPFECGAQRTLVGVEKIPRVEGVEWKAVEGAKVGHTPVHQAQEKELETVHEVVQVVVAEEFVLLHPDGREQHDRTKPLRCQVHR